jgi:hypothetical protein
VFIYSSLHLLEHVRRKDPVRAWCFLSIQLFVLLINILDSSWIVLTHLWLLYLIVVAESVRYSWPSRAHSPAPAAVVQPVRSGPSRRLALRPQHALRRTHGEPSWRVNTYP